jgi:hypothetical protein
MLLGRCVVCSFPIVLTCFCFTMLTVTIESGYTNIVLGVTGNAKDEEVADFIRNGASKLFACISQCLVVHMVC